MAETPEQEELRKQTEAVSQLLSRFGSRTVSLSEAIKIFDARVKSASNDLDRANRAKAAEKQVIEAATAELKELQKQYSKGKIEFSELQQQTDALKESVKQNKQINYETKQVAIASIDAGMKRASTELRNEKIMSAFGQTASIATQVTSGFIKGLQGSRQDPLGGAVDVMKSGATGIASAAKGIGGALSDAAPAIGRIPRIGGMLQAGANGIGAALKIGGAGLEKIKDIADPAIRAISEMTDAFKTASSSGMVFGGGMTELRTLAGQAGMDMRDLAEGIAANSDAFSRAGVSATQAAKMIGNFGRGMTHGREASELMALGLIDVKDRVAMAGNAFEQARMTGTSLAEAQKNISSLTVQYTKDMKVLQAIVGKDAEKAMERGRAAAATTAVQSKLNEDQKKSYAGVVSTFDKFGPAADKMRIALAQLAQGGMVTDAAIRNDPAAMAFLEQTAMLAKSGVDTNAAMSEAGKAMDALQQRVQAEATDPSSARSIIAQSTVQLADGASELMKSVTMISDALILPKTATEDIQATVDNNKKLTQATDQMTTSVLDTIKNQQNLSAALQNVATDVTIVTSIMNVLQTAQKPLEEMINKIKQVTDQLEQMRVAGGGSATQGTIAAMGGAKGIGETAGRTTGQMAGAAIGGTLGVIGGPVGIAVGAALGGFLVDYFAGESFKQVGGAIGSAIGNAVSGGAGVTPAAPMESFGTPMARGGIISGPASGYPVTMHGREMVIPLPDNIKPEAVSQAMNRGSLGNDETANQMVKLMKDLNENFQDMQSIMRSVSDHTARTARGVA
jgi:hypothetical protein